MSDFQTIAQFGDIPENGMIGLVVDDRPIVLINREGTIYALEDRCSHEEFPLSSGDIASGEITCVLHGARFDIETGAPRALPAVMPVKTYEVRVEGEDIQLRLGG
jgi:3-phenylpropionate/trans-cinnamate dioxygenase ferredoxin subunit